MGDLSTIISLLPPISFVFVLQFIMFTNDIPPFLRETLLVEIPVLS